MDKKITIKDIARDLGIHHTTVSRALRNDSRISETTKEKIISYAHEKGYQLNQSAVNLRNTQSNEIALIVPNISHYTFSNFISHVSDLADENNYVVSVFQTKERVENERNAIKNIMQNRVAGVIASLSLTTIDTNHFSELINFGIPVIFFDRIPKDLNAPKVTADNFQAAYDCVKLMIQRGKRKIVHLTGPEHVSVFSDRHKGYIKALEEGGIEYNQVIQFNKEFEINDGLKVMHQLWQQNERPDAVLCDSFSLSAGVNLYCKEKNISVPSELAIIAIANDPFSALPEPPQTIMEQPIKEMANASFELLMKKINGEEKNDIQYHKTRMIIRESI